MTLEQPELLALFALLGVITFALRASFVILQDRITLPPTIRRALTYVPAAVIAAIVAPALLEPSGVTLAKIDVRYLTAPLAVLVAWRSKHVVITIAFGMTALWALTALAGG